MTDFAFLFPFFILLGIAIGILTMIYGVGGGVILVPVIFIYFHTLLGYNETISMKIAVGTSLLNVFSGTLLVIHRHYQKKNIIWPIVIQCSPFVILGACLGMVLAHFVNGTFLKDVFIIFLTFVVCNMAFSKSFKRERTLEDFVPPPSVHLSIASSIIGALSVLLGVGGSAMVVPYLRHYKMPMLQATAVTAVLAPIVAIIGTIGYLYSGLHAHDLLPPHSIGYINWPIFLGVQLGSFVGIVIGERLNAKLSDKARAKWYIMLLLAMLILMIL